MHWTSVHRRHLENTIERSVLVYDAGCRYRYCGLLVIIIVIIFIITIFVLISSSLSCTIYTANFVVRSR